jgi:hypothetical protein
MVDLKFRVLNMDAYQYAASPTIKMDIEILNNDKDEIISVVGKIDIFLEFVSYDQNFGTPLVGREYLATGNMVSPKFTGTCNVTVNVLITAEMDANILYRLRESKRTTLIPFVITFDGFALYKNGDKFLYYQLPTEPLPEAKYYMSIDKWNSIIRTFYGADLVWIKLRRDVVEKIEERKRRYFYLSYTDLIEDLLKRTEEKENVQK